MNTKCECLQKLINKYKQKLLDAKSPAIYASTKAFIQDMEQVKNEND